MPTIWYEKRKKTKNIVFVLIVTPIPWPLFCNDIYSNAINASAKVIEQKPISTLENEQSKSCPSCLWHFSMTWYMSLNNIFKLTWPNFSKQHFPKSTRPSRAGYFHANGQKWAKIETVRDFTPVLVICNFHEDSIKNEVAIIPTTFSPLYVYGRLKGK